MIKTRYAMYIQCTIMACSHTFLQWKSNSAF